jgi:hypothetical protein
MKHAWALRHAILHLLAIGAARQIFSDLNELFLL